MSQIPSQTDKKERLGQQEEEKGKKDMNEKYIESSMSKVFEITFLIVKLFVLHLFFSPLYLHTLATFYIEIP